MSQQKAMYDFSILVLKLGRIMADYIQKEMELAGLSDPNPTAGIVLLPLLDKEGQTLSELARAIHMKAPTITVIANRLENAGWIRRERGTDDRRQVHLFLTKAGRARAEILGDIRRKATLQMAAGISMSSLAKAGKVLDQIIANASGGIG